MPKFSVIIPAYNEAEYIKETVASLKKQTIPRNDFEIIVVDNNSTDATARVAQEAGADKTPKELEKGTNFARQRGVKESKGEILAFLDADSIPPPNWLSEIEKQLKKKGVVAVSGPYNHNFKSWLEKNLNHFYTHSVMPNIPKILEFFFQKKAGVIIGGNFAAWKWAIEKIGGLPPFRFYGDDAATAMLLVRNVGKVVFDPELSIYSSPRRLEKEGLLKTVARYAAVFFKIYFQNWDIPKKS